MKPTISTMYDILFKVT